jgi:hypothetical protein
MKPQTTISPPAARRSAALHRRDDEVAVDKNETSVVPAGEFQPSGDSPFARRSTTPPSHRSGSCSCEGRWVGPAVPGTCATRSPAETPKSCWLNGASRLWSMRGLKRLGSIQVIGAGTRSCRTFAAATTNSAQTPIRGRAFTELTHAI